MERHLAFLPRVAPLRRPLVHDRGAEDVDPVIPAPEALRRPEPQQPRAVGAFPDELRPGLVTVVPAVEQDVVHAEAAVDLRGLRNLAEAKRAIAAEVFPTQVLGDGRTDDEIADQRLA